MELNAVRVGERIRIIRKSKGLTMAEFGEKINNADKSLVSGWEKGRHVPGNARLKLIAELGGMEVDELLHGKRDSIFLFTLDELIDEINRRLTSVEDIH